MQVVSHLMSNLAFLNNTNNYLRLSNQLLQYRYNKNNIYSSKYMSGFKKLRLIFKKRIFITNYIFSPLYQGIHYTEKAIVSFGEPYRILFGELRVNFSSCLHFNTLS